MAGESLEGSDRRLKELETLRTIAETLNRFLDLRQALDETLALLVSLMDLSTAWLFLKQPGGGLDLAAYHGLPPALDADCRRSLRSGDCNCWSLFEEGKLDQAVNIIECSRLESATGDTGGLVYHASVPLKTGDQEVGILNVASPGRELFTDHDLRLLSGVGYQIGAAVERARLMEQRQQLAALEERHRLARDLHDSVTQTLFSLTLTAEAARSLLPEDPKRSRAAIERVQQLAESALAEMRTLIFQLRPVVLDERSLPEALGEVIDRMPRPGGMEVSLRTSGRLDLSAKQEEGLLRIAQEALSNAVRHSQASWVEVRLAAARRAVVLWVRDNGRGAGAPKDAASKSNRGTGLGMSSMRERAAELGAAFRFVTRKDRGTMVIVRLPVERR